MKCPHCNYEHGVENPYKDDEFDNSGGVVGGWGDFYRLKTRMVKPKLSQIFNNPPIASTLIQKRPGERPLQAELFACPDCMKTFIY